MHDVIQPLETTPFAEDSPASRKYVNRPLAVKVIVNFASQSLETPILEQRDIDGLASILRKIGSESQVGSYSVVACSLQRQQVIYRQEDAPRIDLPALGEALNSVSFAKVDVKQLAGKNTETGFLARLLAEEMGKDNPDALIFVSPKCPLDSHMPREVIDRLKNFDLPVFYLNYNLYPSSFPWRDAIGQVVKQLHGFEYTITRPRDLMNAWSDIVSRMARAKQPPGPSRPGF